MKLAGPATLILALLASTARAEEADKSPAIALLLSAGGAVVSFGVAGYGAMLETERGMERESDRYAAIALAGLLVAPSFGHWYAGDALPTGLLVRAGGGALLLTAYAMATECRTDASCAGDHSARVVALAGGGAILAGVLWDIATAPRAARRWNARHDLAITPALTSGGAGLALGGSF